MPVPPPPPPSNVAQLHAVPVGEGSRGFVDWVLSWSLRGKLLACGIAAAAYIGGLATGAGIAGGRNVQPAALTSLSGSSQTARPGPSATTDPPPSEVSNSTSPRSTASIATPESANYFDDSPTPSGTKRSNTPDAASIRSNLSQAVTTAPVPSPTAPSPTTTATMTPRSASAVGPDPFEDLRGRNFLLDLPPLSTGAIAHASTAELGKITTANIADCDLVLVGADAAFGPAKVVTLDADTAQNGSRAWSLNYATRSLTGISVKKPCARLLLDQSTGRLQWTWEPVPPAGFAAMLGALQTCLLKVTVAGETQICTLVRPIKALPLKMSPSQRASPLNGGAAVPSDARLVEFVSRSHTADMPLTTDGRNAAITAANPLLRIELSTSSGGTAASPLSAPRKGARIDIGSDPEIPCYLEVELVDDERNGMPSPVLRSSLFFRRVHVQNGMSIKDDGSPLSSDGFKETMDRLSKIVQLCETMRSQMERSADIIQGESILAGLQRDLRSFSSSSSVTTTSGSTSSSSSSSRRQALENEISRVEQNLEDAKSRLQSDPRFKQAAATRDLSLDYLKRYEALSGELLKFQNETRIDYRISFDQAGRSIVLYDTQLPASGP